MWGVLGGYDGELTEPQWCCCGWQYSLPCHHHYTFLSSLTYLRGFTTWKMKSDRYMLTEFLGGSAQILYLDTRGSLLTTSFALWRKYLSFVTSASIALTTSFKTAWCVVHIKLFQFVVKKSICKLRDSEYCLFQAWLC